MIGNIKIIAVCMCKVYDERNYRIIRALNNFAVENDYRLFVYHTCSDLYWKTLSEKGEQSVFDLIDYNITDAVVTFEEGVYAENVMTKIRMDAAKYGKPVISVGVEHDDCISIKFGYAKGFEQVVRHVIEQHGVRDIGFIAGRKERIDFEGLTRDKMTENLQKLLDNQKGDKVITNDYEDIFTSDKPQDIASPPENTDEYLQQHKMSYQRVRSWNDVSRLD